MRHYPANSPRAAARVVALTLLADGALSGHELNGLARLGIYDRLRLEPSQMHDVLDDLARDLYEFSAHSWGCSGGLNPDAVRCILDDVSDPALRKELLEICHAVAQADHPLTEAESALLAQASTQWRS